MIIAVANQKGGCGKTTTAINLGSAFALNGKRTLVVDMDPQAHASKGLGIKDYDFSLYDVLSKFSSQKKKIRDVIISVQKNLYCAPSNILMSTLEQELAGQIGRESILNDIMSAEDIAGEFDYVIIDCPPNLGILTINALRASGSLIIPVETSFFSIEGLGQIVEIVDLLEERLSCSIEWKILVNLFDSRLKHSIRLLKEVRAKFGDRVFTSIIHINVKLKEAQGEGKPIFMFDKYARGARDYFSLAKEIISKTARIPWTIKIQGNGIKEISVVGDFNKWQPLPAFSLQKTSGGEFKKTFYLVPGTYRYKLVIDGDWKEDPTNPKKAVNPFGGFDSLLELG